MLPRVASVRLDPERALVVVVEDVLPGEADPAVDLDRALAGGDGRVGRVALRRRDGDRRLVGFLGDAPRRPVGERTGELRLNERVRERMRDGLVDADRPPELLARLGVLDGEVERLRPAP